MGSPGGRAARLAPYGILTCLDLADADGRLVKNLLTKAGHDIWLELNGVPVTPVRSERPAHQVLARGGSLMGRVECPTLLWAWCVRHVERLIEELRFHGVKTASLGVEVVWRDAAPTGGAVRGLTPTDRFDHLLDAARVALRQAYLPGRAATHLHVFASELRRGSRQLSLFEPPNPQLDALAGGQGGGQRQVRPLQAQGAPRLCTSRRCTADPANDFDICDVRGKICF